MIKAKGIQYFKRMSCANGIFNLIRGQQIEDIHTLYPLSPLSLFGCRLFFFLLFSFGLNSFTVHEK